jgi:signal transduction histidine kinase
MRDGWLPAERRLLTHIRSNMAMLLVATYALLAGAIIGYTYWAMDRALTGQVEAAIVRDEWPGHLDAVLRGTAASGGEADRERPHALTDARPETMATWVVAADGTVVERDVRVVGLPGSIAGLVPDPVLESIAARTKAPVFQAETFHGRPVMVAVKPVYGHHALVGYLETVASLVAVKAALSRVVQEDVGLSIAVLVVIVPLSLWLSRRAVLPIREALSRQRDFVHNASHELRTPLAIVKAALELAMPDPGDPHYETLSDAARSVEHLTEIVGDLATLARMESGHAELDRRLIDLVPLVRETTEVLRPLAQGKSIRLEVSLPEAPMPCYGDPTRLRQLLLILGDNAIRYTPTGGMIRVTLAWSGTHGASVVVQDSGVGIAPADLPHIFDRFYRGRLTRSITGTGLGLAIARWIVEAHHGTIHVSSEAGKGTTFTIRLPVRPLRLSTGRPVPLPRD